LVHVRFNEEHQGSSSPASAETRSGWVSSPVSPDRAATSQASAAGNAAKQGGRSEARDIFAALYGSFTEGFAAADLKEVKALREELT